eukprot:scaffold56988_cov32-Tisochrysis_lutea.AAC.1
MGTSLHEQHDETHNSLTCASIFIASGRSSSSIESVCTSSVLAAAAWRDRATSRRTAAAEPHCPLMACNSLESACRLALELSTF